jgi:hypothetical protein
MVQGLLTVRLAGAALTALLLLLVVTWQAAAAGS